MNDDPDVLVIGAGAIGICSGYYLDKQGLSITIVEQKEVASGCSGANAGLIVPSQIIPLAAPGVLCQGIKWMLKPDSPFYIKPRFDPVLFSWLWKFRKASRSQQMLQGLHILRDLSSASRELFDCLISGESLSCGFREDGWLLVYRTAKGFEKAREEAHLLESYDVEVNILSAEEALERESRLHPGLSGAVFFPGDAHLDPEMFINGLADRLRERKVTILEQTRVLELETSNDNIRAVRTTHGDFKPKHVVLAAGAWSSGLVKKFGFDLPVQPAKGYSISVKKTEASPTIPLYLSEARVAVTPLEDVLRFAGTMEFSGMDFSINRRRVDAIMQAAGDYLREGNVLEVVDTWHGYRPCTPDGLPIVERSPLCENLIIATGHCMLGISLAPITGRLASQLVCRQTPDVDLKWLQAARFR